MADIDLGKVTMTEEEVQQIIDKRNEGVRLGKDADGNPGYYKFDESAGADTLIPFKLGGTDISGIEKIYSDTGNASNTQLKTANITFLKKYQAVVAVMASSLYTYYPSNDVRLPTNTLTNAIATISAGTGRGKVDFYADTNLKNYSVGSTYTIEYRWYHGANTLPNGYFGVYGIY